MGYALVRSDFPFPKLWPWGIAHVFGSFFFTVPSRNARKLLSNEHTFRAWLGKHLSIPLYRLNLRNHGTIRVQEKYVRADRRSKLRVIELVQDFGDFGPSTVIGNAGESYSPSSE